MFLNEGDTSFIPSGVKSRSTSARADELMRVAPRGVRTVLVPVATGERELEDLPEWATDWLLRREVIRPAQRRDAVWARTKLLNALMKRVEARYA